LTSVKARQGADANWSGRLAHESDGAAAGPEHQRGTSKSAAPLRIGVVGFGPGGRLFHTPFIQAAEGTVLAGVVARSEPRRLEVARHWPEVPVHHSLGEMLESGVQAVTITTPPETHRDLALEAISAGVHVIVDKPFAPSGAVGREIAAAAEAAGVTLSVYNNRRWDADFQTLRRVVSEEHLGELWRVYSRFDLDEPGSLHSGEGNGLLLDIGSHLIDQLLCLLGPVTAVTAHLDWIELPAGPTDAGFSVNLVHASGVTSYAEASKANRIVAREFRAYGSKGSYRSNGTDVQTQSLLSGRMPAAHPDDWGYETPTLWGTLSNDTGEQRIPSAQGRWQDFYALFAAAVKGGTAPPVTAVEAVSVLDVIDAARISDFRGETVRMEEAGCS